MSKTRQETTCDRQPGKSGNKYGTARQDEKKNTSEEVHVAIIGWVYTQCKPVKIIKQYISKLHHKTIYIAI